MNENLSFPTTFKKLAVEWLNIALEKELKARIISFNDDKKIEQELTGEVFLIFPKYENEKEKNLPKSVKIKSQISHSWINSHFLIGCSKEIRIYPFLLKVNNLNVAKIYLLEINKVS